MLERTSETTKVGMAGAIRHGTIFLMLPHQAINTKIKDQLQIILRKTLQQVQKKKNSRNYQRTLTYLYLQKLKCPKYNRILGGKATTKKNGKPYYYYYCNDCKIFFKEKVINDYFNQFINELVEYDSVVNRRFLPMIKQKFDDPKEQLEKEIKEQESKLERIKKAYINGVFKLKEYDEKKEVRTIYGTDDIVNDIKQLYLDEFEQARLEYNEKQTREDRKIENYFQKVCESQNDIACEIIIELGDMDFWQDKDQAYRLKMIDVYNEQISNNERIRIIFRCQ